MGSLFAWALVLQYGSDLSLQLGFWFASVLNRSFNLKLAWKFEGLGRGKKSILLVLNSNHV